MGPEHDPPTRTRQLALVLAILTTLAHLLLAGRYGYFRDELYYIACGRHLAWGYVDHPPMIAVLARVATAVFGESLVGLRVIPALAAGALVGLAGELARRLGGGSFAVALVGISIALGPGFLFVGHVLTMNAIEPLIWLGVVLLVVALLQGGDRRLWLGVGLLVGLGLLTKHSTLFFTLALVGGLALTPERRVLASRELAIAIVIATVLVLPHAVWQLRHDVPQLEMLRNAAAHKNAPFAVGEFLFGQVELIHPLYFLLALAGLAALLADERLRRERALGLAFVLLLGLYVVLEAKAYYMAPAYPMLLAAGAVWLESRVRRVWARASVLVLGLASGAVLAPLSVPVLDIEGLIAYQAALGLAPNSAERHQLGVLPQHIADQHGWPELVETLAEAHAALPASERERTLIYAQNYGEAGAVDWLGRRYALPPAISGHNSYFLWGPGAFEPAVLLFIGGDPGEYAQLCASVEHVATTPANPYVMPYESELPIYACRGLLHSPAELWPSVKHYE